MHFILCFLFMLLLGYTDYKVWQLSIRMWKNQDRNLAGQAYLVACAGVTVTFFAGFALLLYTVFGA